ncbi:tetratricopeptide repeat protein [Haliangium sp.]|uniref:tetratricopeptide repeat protein n=1 Tax=Haliangium sp. TaxID=2663208 RepID=UPI003D0D6DC4
MVLGTLAACSAPAGPADLSAAEAAARAGDLAAAEAAYRDAQASCGAIAATRQRREACAHAYLDHAELLERAGRRAEAADAYEAAEAALSDDAAAAATAVYRAGRLRLELGEEVRGYQLLWRSVTDYPDQAHAPDALRLVLADGRRRAPDELYRALAGLVTPLARTRVADNLLYAMADLAEHDQDDPRAALAMYDKIVTDYATGPLRDDAGWHGARLARQLGDPRGAVARLRALLSTREVALLAGSHFSVWLDDAQLQLGRVLRDDLGELPAAAAAFLRLPVDYPDSVLIDDALWEAAQTWDRVGDADATCAALDRLGHDHPESRYQIRAAPELRRRRGCSPPPG